MANSDLAVNYEAVLADLRAKRDKLDAAIAGIEAMLGVAPSALSQPESATVATGQDIQFDTFFNLSIPDAARKLLTMRKRAQTTQEITSALEAGGFKHQSEAFGNTVGSVLNRIDKAGGDIVKVGRAKWGLAAWYPNGKRKRNGNKNETDDSPEESEEAPVNPFS